MIVRLTNHRWSVLRTTNFGPEIEAILELDVSAHGKGAVLVRQPYISWAIIREHIYRRTFTPRGARNRHVSETYFSLLRDIQTAINVRDRHPALRSLAVLERQVDRIPAWETSGGLYCPRPNGGRFVILDPVDVSTRALRATAWAAREPSPGDDWLCDEAVHLLLWPQAVDTLGWNPQVDTAGVDE